MTTLTIAKNKKTFLSMKKFLFVFVVAFSLVSLTGCVITKEQAYFQNMDSVSLAGVKMRPEIHIKPNDELTITVTSTNPEAAEPFNMTLRNNSYSSNIQSVSTQLYTYIVDQDGYINFPVIGKVKVGGLTRPQCEDFLLTQVKPFFAADERPVVKVRFSSFTVTVIGEVGGPRTINVSNERISIIEALAQAGDLSVYGKRPNVLLIRELSNGEKITARYNMNDANMLNSEYYYLQQNDVVYIEPHKSKARSADVNASFWSPISSVLISLATLVISLTR